MIKASDYLKINEILQTKRITLPKLSEKSGIKVENLITILKSNVTLRNLKRIADGLDYRLADLVKQKLSAHGYISFTVNGTKRNTVFNDIESIQRELRLIKKKIDKLEIQNEEIKIYDRFIAIIERSNCDVTDVVKAINIKNNSKTTKQNLIYSLNPPCKKENPTLKTLVDICDVLDVELSELLSSNSDYEIQGVVVINGDVITLNSLSDLERAIDVIGKLTSNIISDAEIQEIINEILLFENHVSITKESNDISNLNFSEDDLRMDRNSTIDSRKDLCYSFRKKGDLRDGKLLNFSNMLKGFPFEFLGQQFKDSECAYIAGCYTSNNDHCTRIQSELSVYDKGGYNAKSEYRKAKIENSNNTPYIRADWNTFNFDWMLLVLWYKVNNNSNFREMLMQIPLNAHIIEDTSYHKGVTAAVWGCKNKDLTELRQSKRNLLRSKLLEKGVFKLKTLSEAEQIIDNKINNVGVWEGQNATGKALKLCQIAIAKNELPPINFDFINSKDIYWFERRIEIYADENNKIQKREIE